MRLRHVYGGYGPDSGIRLTIVGSEDGEVALLQMTPSELFFTEAVENRMKNAESLAGFFTNTLSGRIDPNFLSLYSLSPWMIEAEGNPNWLEPGKRDCRD